MKVLVSLKVSLFLRRVFYYVSYWLFNPIEYTTGIWSWWSLSVDRIPTVSTFDGYDQANYVGSANAEFLN
jgi:hypothetical protein